MSKIAKPVFNGAPTDNLETVDVYGSVDPTVRNNFTSQFTAFSKTLSERLNPQRQELEQLNQDLKSGRVSDPKDVEDRLKSVLKGSRGAFSNLSDSDKERMISRAMEDTAYENAYINVQGIRRKIDGTDMKSASSIVDMMRDVTNNDLFKTLDLGAEVGMASVALDTISMWQIPELVDAVMEDMDEETKREVARQSAPRLASSADIDSLERLINQVGAAALTADVPDFSLQIIQRYKLKPTESPADYPHRLAQLVAVLDALKPDWLYVQRGTDTIYNLEVVHKASSDAVTLLCSDPTYRTPALTASNFPPKGSRTLIKAMYPMIALVD